MPRDDRNWPRDGRGALVVSQLLIVTRAILEEANMFDFLKRPLIRRTAIAFGALLVAGVAAAPAPAEAGWYHHPGYWHHSWGYYHPYWGAHYWGPAYYGPGYVYPPAPYVAAPGVYVGIR